MVLDKHKIYNDIVLLILLFLLHILITYYIFLLVPLYNSFYIVPKFPIYNFDSLDALEFPLLGNLVFYLDFECFLTKHILSLEFYHNLLYNLFHRLLYSLVYHHSHYFFHCILLNILLLYNKLSHISNHFENTIYKLYLFLTFL